MIQPPPVTPDGRYLAKNTPYADWFAGHATCACVRPPRGLSGTDTD